MIISTTGEKRSDSGRPYPTTADLNISKKSKKNQIFINRAVKRITSIDELSVFIYNKLTTIFHCLHSDYPRDDVNDFQNSSTSCRRV